MLAATADPIPLDHVPEDQAAAVLLALQPGVTYKDVAVRLGLEPADVLRLLREGLVAARRAAGPTAVSAGGLGLGRLP